MSDRVKTLLVVPSNREGCFREFMLAWHGRGGWDAVCLVEDNPTQTFSVPGVDYHFAHEDIARILDPDAWIISRRDSAIRCFGFLVAYHLGMDVLTLDDDCFPLPGHIPIVDAHRRAMAGHRRWASSVPGMRVRGLPYEDAGPLDLAANVGLWENVPDLGAREQLSWDGSYFRPPPGSRIVPQNQYAPVCGMNLFVRRQALPLFYFPLMGEGSPYKRFDDIWCGVIAKRLLDHLGWSLSVGEPFVEHRRASDPHKNLAAEAPGVAANEAFWRKVDWVGLDRGFSSAADLAADLGRGLSGDSDPYVARLGEALGVWSRLFEKAPPLLPKAAGAG